MEITHSKFRFQIDKNSDDDYNHFIESVGHFFIKVFITKNAKEYIALEMQHVLKRYPFYAKLEVLAWEKDAESQKYQSSFPISITSSSPLNYLNLGIPVEVFNKWTTFYVKGKFSIIPSSEISAGLINKGYICYLNAVLQMLYNIPAFRKMIYSYPPSEYNPKDPEIMICLQRLFSMMSDNLSPAYAKELTESFGWNEDDLSVAQDAHEFLIAFLSKLGQKLSKYKELYDIFDSLFQGEETQSTCNFKSERVTQILPFNTIPLEVGKYTVFENSLHAAMNFVSPEIPVTFPKLHQAFGLLMGEKGLPEEFQVIADFLNNNINNSSTNNLNEDDDYKTNNNIASLIDKNLNMALYKIITDSNEVKSNECKKLVNALNNFIKEKNISKDYKEFKDSLDDIIKNKGNSNIGIGKKLKDFYFDQQIYKATIIKNHFKKLPKLLIFQLCRFNNKLEKNEICFEYPPSFNLSKYTENHVSADYKLFSVIAHQGSLNIGHYLAYNRFANNDIWFKMNEKNVTMVNENSVFANNFGNSRNMKFCRSDSLAPFTKQGTQTISPKGFGIKGYDRNQPSVSTAYLLLYINTQYIDEILNVKVEIPTSLIAYRNNKMAIERKKQPTIVESKTVDFYLMTDEIISAKIEKDHFCIVKDFCDLTPICLQRKDSTTNDIYEAVSKQLNNDTFRLWQCNSSGFVPKCVLPRSKEIKIEKYSYYDTLLFLDVQKVNSTIFDCSPSCEDALFFVLFFDPVNQNNFKYIGYFSTKIENSVDSLIPLIKRQLNTEKDLLISCESKPNFAITLKNDFTFSSQKVVSGSVLIAQYKIDCANTTHYKDGALFTKDINNYSDVMEPCTVEYFFQMKYNSIDITFYQFGEDRQHLTLKIPQNIQISSLAKVLSHEFHYDNKDEFTNGFKIELFPVYGNNYPSTLPFNVKDPDSTQIGAILPPHIKHTTLFFELFSLSEISLCTNVKSFSYRFEVSDDAIVPNTMHQLWVTSNTIVSDIAEKIGIPKSDLVDGNKYRILMIIDGKIVKMSSHDRKLLDDKYIIRFEKIPEVQKANLPSSPDSNQDDRSTNTIQVLYGVKSDTKVLTFGIPFIFTLYRDEPIEDLVKRLKASMKYMSPDDRTDFVLVSPLKDISRNFSLSDAFAAAKANLSICIIMNNVSIKSVLSFQKQTTDRQLKIYK